MDFDVIVIGAGIGGLTSAARLALSGYKIGVFEQHFLAGGYATNFKRKNFNFDVSLHGIGGLEEGGNCYNILKVCDIMHRIKPIKNKIAYSIKWKGNLIDIPNDIEQYKQLLFELFPSKIKEIAKLFTAIYNFEDGFNRFVLKNHGTFFSKVHKNTLLFMNWSFKTTDEVIRSYVDNDDFIRFFSVLWPYYGLPPKELSAIYFFIPWISYHCHGKFYIEGGGQKLSNAFIDVINENQGQVHLKCEVTKIEISNDLVSSIQLKDGRSFTAKQIIYNGSPINVLKLLPEKSLSSKDINKILNDKIGCTLSQLYIGLDCIPNVIGIPDDEVFYLGGKSAEEDYKLSLENNYLESGFLLTNYSTMDSSIKELNNGVIAITYIDNYDYWSNDKNEYKRQKEKVKQLILDRLEGLFPSIKEHIVISELGTPKTMERYTLNPKGSVYGYAQSVNQAGKNRLKQQSTLKNLIFTGAWVKPGGGYEGCISSGIMAALDVEKVLKSN